MEAPRHYSASPLHSFVTVPTGRQPTLAATLKAIWLWWRPRAVPLRERQLEEAVVERIAAELEDGETSFSEINPTGISRKDRR